MQLEVRPRLAVGIVEPFVGVEPGIAVEVIRVAVKCIAARLRCHHHIGAAIAAVFRGGVQGNGAEFLHVVGIQALDVALRVRDR